MRNLSIVEGELWRCASCGHRGEQTVHGRCEACGSEQLFVDHTPVMHRDREKKSA
jgi:DNA-directed RNA polymerase subunit RPC12/RpoP